MKAITYTTFGPADQVLELKDIPTPDPAPGEVLVRVHLSGVNPSDVKARAGSRPGVTKPPFPTIIPHSDGSGVIDAVGEGVDPVRIGQRVWIWNGQWQRALGTCAEFIALPSEQAVAMPDAVSDEIGAVLGIPGLTAVHCVLGAGNVAGQTLLISGGSGMVGHIAVQVAKSAGARVIATTSPAKAQIARDAGADAVLDYAAPDLASQILAANDGQPVDRAVEVEFGRNADTLAEVIAPNGRITAYGSAQDMTPRLPFYPLMFKAVTLEMALIYLLTPAERDRAVTQANALAARGKLAPCIGPIFDITDCAAAHGAVENGARDGAVLVKTT